MTQEHFQQASILFKAGDKLGAEKILLEITQQEPANADAWYALALCTSSTEERKARLEKCLAISPDHSRALNSLARLQEVQKAQPTPDPVAVSNKLSEIKNKPENETYQENKQKNPRSHISSHWIYSPIILILIVLVAWLYLRMDGLEKSLVALNANVNNHRSSITSLNDNISNLQTNIFRINGQVNTLASGLDYVTPLAENANRYAHSHTTTYSDIRLKTNISEIQNSLDKVLQLRGVYYQWNLAEFPQLNFSDQPQVGVIAQEVEKVFPELVSTDANGFKEVDYEKLSAVLIEAIREQQKEIITLTNQINP